MSNVFNNVTWNYSMDLVLCDIIPRIADLLIFPNIGRSKEVIGFNLVCIEIVDKE
jgi:hypothetical protein